MRSPLLPRPHVERLAEGGGVERRELGAGGRDGRRMKLGPDLPVADLAAAWKGQQSRRGRGSRVERVHDAERDGAGLADRADASTELDLAALRLAREACDLSGARTPERDLAAGGAFG